jgi:hypothetical protein
VALQAPRGVVHSRPSLDLADPRLHAAAVPSTHVHYDEQGRAEVPRRRIRRIGLIVVAVLVVLWIIGLIVSYTLFNVGGEVPGNRDGRSPHAVGRRRSPAARPCQPAAPSRPGTQLRKT